MIVLVLACSLEELMRSGGVMDGDMTNKEGDYPHVTSKEPRPRDPEKMFNRKFDPLKIVLHKLISALSTIDLR